MTYRFGASYSCGRINGCWISKMGNWIYKCLTVCLLKPVHAIYWKIEWQCINALSSIKQREHEHKLIKVDWKPINVSSQDSVLFYSGVSRSNVWIFNLHIRIVKININLVFTNKLFMRLNSVRKYVLLYFSDERCFKLQQFFGFCLIEKEFLRISFRNC